MQNARANRSLRIRSDYQPNPADRSRRENDLALRELSGGTNIQANFQNRFRRPINPFDEQPIWPSSRTGVLTQNWAQSSSMNAIPSIRTRETSSGRNQSTDRLSELLARVQVQENLSYEALIALDETVRKTGVDLAIYKTYKRISYKSWKQNNPDQMEPDCVICFDPLFKKEYVSAKQRPKCDGQPGGTHKYLCVVELPCQGKHSFHSRCIRKWLRSNATCPYCRENLNQTHLRQTTGNNNL